MPNWLDSAREFLGLGHDPYYDDFDEDVEYGEPEIADRGAAAPSARNPRGPSAVSARSVSPDSKESEDDAGVRMIPTRDGNDYDDRGHQSSGVPTITPAPSAASDRAVVRPIPTASKPEVVHPSVFEDSRAVADAVKQMQPVILNLQGVERDLSRRLIDFASGLSYGLDVEMERVAKQVFLLTPKGADVSADERKRLQEGQYSN